jgi:hypothetical protein
LEGKLNATTPLLVDLCIVVVKSMMMMTKIDDDDDDDDIENPVMRFIGIKF